VITDPERASEGSDEDRSALFSLPAWWMNSQVSWRIWLCDEFLAASLPMPMCVAGRILVCPGQRDL